jgi:hypothetical protein
MNCVVCKVNVMTWERPQRMRIGTGSYAVPPLCDRCARENQYRPGSPEALERLVRGGIDEEELARVRAATPTEWDTPPDERGRP